MPWAGAVLSAVLLDLPFPVAGPMPAWRGLIAFVALAPLIWAVLAEEKLTSGAKAPNQSNDGNAGAEAPAYHLLRRAFLIGYLCGVLWYAGNCYWIYDTMQIHGGVSPTGSMGILLLFSLVLGGYFGLFGLGARFVAQKVGIGAALLAAPFFWTAIDLVAARVTSVPWDQLGYSQVDNALLAQFAQTTGVYGITFVLVGVNAMVVHWIVAPMSRKRYAVVPIMLIIAMSAQRWAAAPARVATSATAVLMQPNLDVESAGAWPGPLWDQQISQFTGFATRNCGSAMNGVPETGAAAGQSCGQPSLVAWPESPAPYYEDEDRFREAMKGLALRSRSPLVIGGVGMGQDAANDALYYNSAIVFDARGNHVGRYDKIHLVPFGEFVPYRELFFFAKKLTRKVGETSRGTGRPVFRLEDASGQTHRYGIFICYESVFADEVREFAKSGAEVFVNISDDGWYGDTSAPWQHLNMARMRAIENRRWILRDTNNGVTAVIDPWGVVRQSIPRHSVGALVAQYGFNSETTFYTLHGDVFAWVCAILSVGMIVWVMNLRGSPKVSVKSGLRAK